MRTGFFKTGQYLSHPAKIPAESGAIFPAQLTSSPWMLLRQFEFQFWLESQHFLLRCNPTRLVPAHDAGQVHTNAHQTIFRKLLAGHPVQRGLVDVPGPGQHLVGQVFLTGTIARFWSA
jgi:hypothetical protein